MDMFDEETLATFFTKLIIFALFGVFMGIIWLFVHYPRTMCVICGMFATIYVALGLLATAY